jgi:hypothetical protein
MKDLIPASALVSSKAFTLSLQREFRIWFFNVMLMADGNILYDTLSMALKLHERFNQFPGLLDYFLETHSSVLKKELAAMTGKVWVTVAPAMVAEQTAAACARCWMESRTCTQLSSPDGQCPKCKDGSVALELINNNILRRWIRRGYLDTQTTIKEKSEEKEEKEEKEEGQKGEGQAAAAAAVGPEPAASVPVCIDCDETFATAMQLTAHQEGIYHALKLMVNEDLATHGFLYRAPPNGVHDAFTYHMCRSESGEKCSYGKLKCTHAHSFGELLEWMERRRRLRHGIKPPATNNDSLDGSRGPTHPRFYWYFYQLYQLKCNSRSTGIGAVMFAKEHSSLFGKNAVSAQVTRRRDEYMIKMSSVQERQVTGVSLLHSSSAWKLLECTPANPSASQPLELSSVEVRIRCETAETDEWLLVKFTDGDFSFIHLSASAVSEQQEEEAAEKKEEAAPSPVVVPPLLLPAKLRVLQRALLLDCSGQQVMTPKECNDVLLRTAVLMGSIGWIQALLNTGANPNARDSNSRTSLHLACIHIDPECRVNMVKALVSHGANVFVKDCVARTPINYAQLLRYTDVLDLLMAHGRQQEKQGEPSTTTLESNGDNPSDCSSSSSSSGGGTNINILGAVAYLNQGAEIDAWSPMTNMNALYYALISRDLTVVCFLMCRGANVLLPRPRTNAATTAIQHAIKLGHYPTLVLMLYLAVQRRASAAKQVVQYCITEGCLEALSALHRLDVLCSGDQLPLHYAAEHGTAETMSFLVQLCSGTDMLQRLNYAGYRPLDLAYRRYRFDIVEIIFRQCAYHVWYGGNEMSLLLSAMDANDMPQVMAMVQRKPDLVLEMDDFGQTALHHAAIKGNIDAAEFFISVGANVHATDFFQETPLAKAYYQEHFQLADILSKYGSSWVCTPSESLLSILRTSLLARQ